ncbi:sensor histidine kinase [Sphingobacterium bovisgrunnientis]|uniref:sensor histidine kinase n=1 Tax=Sphingobacterium bovisgrunnientis TaxID=1874697 RepID=UPI0021D0183D|nr:ATP-binding protein [Sphingobacterium bovisgrunnientis]
MQYKANEKSQLLKTNLTPINIAINKEKIRRVLDNILNNAIKFSSRNSNIEIMLLDKDQHTIQIRIADNGIGIPEEFRSKLFDLNPNIRREGTLGEESFGLGLYICKQIIDQHKGKIWIENNADQGTIFIIELPKS